MEHKGIVTSSDRINGKKNYKHLLPVLVVLIIFGLIVGVKKFDYYLAQRGADKAAGNCTAENAKVIARAYYKATDNTETKALRAEQAGNCYSLVYKNDDSLWWYRKAAESYKNNKNLQKSYQMALIADNMELNNSIPKSIVPAGVTDEQTKQGLGSN